MTTHPLAQFLEGLRQENDDMKRKTESAVRMRRDPDLAIPILRDAIEAWDEPNPYTRGDIVKAAAHSSLWREEAGMAIVLDTHARVDIAGDDLTVHSHNMNILVIHEGGGTIEMLAHSRDFDLVMNAHSKPVNKAPVKAKKAAKATVKKAVKKPSRK